MENSKLDELIAALQTKVDNIAASVGRITDKQDADEAAKQAAAKQQEEESKMAALKASLEEEFKKKYNITEENHTDKPAETETPAKDNPSIQTVGLQPNIQVEDKTISTYKTVDEIIAEQRKKRYN